MRTVLFTAPYMIPVLGKYEPVFKTHELKLLVPEVRERLEETDLLKYAGQIDAAVCGDDRYTERVLEAFAPRLKVISKWGTGIDSIDTGACSRLGIRLYRTLNAFTTPVADSVMGYILGFARRQPWMDRDVKAGKWIKLPGRALSECTLGIIGVGNIGKAVARRARSFGLQILGNDIVEIDHVFVAESGIKMTTLDSLLALSDFVSINCDLNPTSHRLIDARALAQMKPGAVLINTARGPILDEDALVQALQANRLGGAALDVFEVEPPQLDSPLLKMDNVLLAPHNSNSSPAAWDRVHRSTIQNLLEGLALPADLLQVP
jgi:D-3-phosphoglycerate dehydrogenase